MVNLELNPEEDAFRMFLQAEGLQRTVGTLLSTDDPDLLSFIENGLEIGGSGTGAIFRIEEPSSTQMELDLDFPDTLELSGAMETIGLDLALSLF